MPFVWCRLPFYLYSRLPIPWPDSATYLWPLQDIEAGRWPAFDLRTPGYPLFWWVCRRVSHTVLLVVCCQSALNIGVAIAALWLLRRHAARLVVPVAATLAVFLSGNAHLTWEMSLLSDGLFTTSAMAFCLFLFLAVKTWRVRFCAAASVAALAATYLRPPSVYLIGLLAATAAYGEFRRAPRRGSVALLVPMAAGLLFLVAYNAATIRVVGLSGGGTWARLWSTTVYLDPDPALPPAINLAMRAKNKDLSADDKAAIYGPSSLRAFRDALEKNIGVGIGQIADHITGWPTRYGWRYMENRAMLDGVVNAAIAQHPHLYLKNVAGTTVDYFRVIETPQPNLYELYPRTTTYAEAFVRPPFYVTNLAGYYAPRRPGGFAVSKDGRVTTATHALDRWYARFSTWRSALFENALWMWMLPAALVVSVWRLWTSKGASSDAFAMLAFLAVVVGNALAPAYIGHVEVRYVVPFHFVNYLIGALGATAGVRALRGARRPH